ncbi:MAG: hypothetical protein AB8V03_03605 [Francisella endosymbiont of Hyalomma asiaticum]
MQIIITVLNRFDKLQRFSALAITKNISMVVSTRVLPEQFAFLVADLKYFWRRFIFCLFYIL